MPYISIKCYPKDDSIKKAAVEKLAEVFTEVWGCPKEALTISLEEVDPAVWKEEIVEKEIRPNMEHVMILNGEKQYPLPAEPAKGAAEVAARAAGLSDDADGSGKSGDHAYREKNPAQPENDEGYVVFTITASDGTDYEMAVVDEFEYDRKHYVVSAVIDGDTILDEERYIYRCVFHGNTFTAEKIEDPKEYAKVTTAYLELED